MSDKSINLVIVTGMSGAGKTVAIQSFEDLGYFTIDNMPPALVPKFIELIEQSSDNNRVALVVDSFLMKSILFLIKSMPIQKLILKFYSWMRQMVNWLLVIKKHVVVIRWQQMDVF